MFAEEQGPSETAIDYTNEFVDAGVAKLDALFGAGYAREHPQMLAAYVAACSSNLNAFMVAAASIGSDGDLEQALMSFEEELPPEPHHKPKGRRR